MQNNKNYFSNIRSEIFKLIPKNIEQNILEIGCGNGNTLGKLKEEGYASFTMGIEKNNFCENEALKNNIDHFICDDIENLKNQIDETFDVILFLDVLEHLVDPWNVLNKIVLFLKSDGIIIISIPNIRNFSIFKKLFLKGRWDYEESGILDWTHLRFFTDSSFKDDLIKHLPNSKFEKTLRNYDDMNITKKFLNKIPIFRELFTCQLLYKIKII